MENRPEFIESLERDLKQYQEAIKEVSESLIADEITRYPVFIVYRSEYFPIGEKVLDKTELGTQWSVNASSAETLINEGIIQLDKAKYFLSQYKPAESYMCLFVIPDEASAHFIFYPY